MVGVHKGIITLLGEQLGEYTLEAFKKIPTIRGGLIVKNGRRLSSTAQKAGVSTNPEGQNPNVDLGVFTEETNSVCEY